MLVAVAKFEMYFPFCHNLKEKRSYIQKIKGRGLEKFKITLNEVGYQDTWQRAQFGFAIVGTDSRYLESLMDQLLDFVGSLGLGDTLNCQKDIVSF